MPRFHRALTISVSALAITIAGGPGPSGAPGVRPASAGTPAQAAAAIRLGAVLPLSGKFSASGKYFQQGYELAAEEANQAGGLDVGGKKMRVELTILDDGSDPTKSRSLVE